QAAHPLRQEGSEHQTEQRDALQSRVYVTSPPPVRERWNTPIRREDGVERGGPRSDSVSASSGRPGWLHSPLSASGMMLMVSVQNMEEALEAERGGADIVDIKNLQEAMVGSGHPMLARDVRARIPAEKHVSVTLGVVPNQPGTVAMAVYAAAQLY